mmetsp:Transcript_30928/g.78302  ORF Transcript_30928/g.78302 Transcript_30928/m.78302 type:complete len:709 (-) Transcript_30928:193-2319(-)
MLQGVARDVGAGEAGHVGGNLEQEHALAATHLQHALGLVRQHPVAGDAHPLLDDVARVHQVGEGVKVGRPVHRGVGVLLVRSGHVLVHGAIDVAPHLDPPLLLDPRRDGLVVELARSVDGQRVAAHHPLRGEVRLGQLVREGVVELLAGDGVIGEERGHADEEAVNGLDGHHLDHALEALVGHALDLAELEAHAADLDLAIRAAKVLEEAPLGMDATDVARTVDVAPRAVELVGHEALRRELRALEVAHGDLDAADADLAPLALGHLLGGVLEIRDVHGHALVGEAEAEARRRVLVHLGVLRVAVQRRHVDGRLGGAVEVPQLDVVAKHLLELGVVGAEERLTDAVDVPQVLGTSLAARGDDTLGVVQEEVEERGHKHAGRNVAAVHGGEDGLGVKVEVGAEHARRGAEHQGLPDLRDGHVESVDRLHQEDILRRASLDLEGLDGALPEASGGHRHALGPARGPRRVHDVHALVGRELPAGAGEFGLCLLDKGLGHAGGDLDSARGVDAEECSALVRWGRLLRVSDDSEGLELVEDPVVALHRPLGVEGRKGEAGLEHSKLRNGHGGAPGEDDGHDGARRARRSSAQDGRNLLGKRVHLSVGGHPGAYRHDISSCLRPRKVEQAGRIGAFRGLRGQSLREGQTRERRSVRHTPGGRGAGGGSLYGTLGTAHGGIACRGGVASLMNRRHRWSWLVLGGRCEMRGRYVAL